MTHQDHFRCSITCGYCGKRRHYEDECHKKKGESDKLKRQEAERQRTQTPARNPPNPPKANPAGAKRVGRQGRPAKRDRGTRRGKREERNRTPPPNVHTPHCRAPGHSRAPTGPAMEPNGPARERVCPRACATARPGKERAPHAGQAGHTRSTARQHAPQDKTRHHNGKHPHSTTNEPPRTSPSPAVPTARQPPSGWTCVRPAGNPAPAGPEPAAVRMDVCAPGRVPNPYRLRNSRRPDRRVCARQ